jgi:hypothetical protein
VAIRWSTAALGMSGIFSTPSLPGHTVEMFSLRLIALDEAKTMILALWGEHACDERPTKSRPMLVHS